LLVLLRWLVLLWRVLRTADEVGTVLLLLGRLMVELLLRRLVLLLWRRLVMLLWRRLVLLLWRRLVLLLLWRRLVLLRWTLLWPRPKKMVSLGMCRTADSMHA